MKRVGSLLLMALVAANVALAQGPVPETPTPPTPVAAIGTPVPTATAGSVFDFLRPRPSPTPAPTATPTPPPLGRPLRTVSNANRTLGASKSSGSIPAMKLIPDSELVNGPAAAGFDMGAFLDGRRGYLTRYSERVRDEVLSGEQIIDRVAYQFSVNPRLLLAMLEWQGGWLDDPNPTGNARLYPDGEINAQRPNLYLQVAWAAARLNEGYYGVRLGTRQQVALDSGAKLDLPAGVNAGTAGLMSYIAAVSGSRTWAQAMGEGGFMATYRSLFGDPAQYDAGPPVPAGTQQPKLRLPWAEGETWLFTGGAHSAWGVGAPWGAVDFTTASVGGCQPLPEWALAVADGTIARSRNGEVGLSLHPGGDERVGWSVFYMHVGAVGRAASGTRVLAGDRIGHPACDGGLSIAAHLHIARKLNGEWLPALSAIPYTLGAWTFTEDEAEYDGYAIKGSEVREATETRDPAINGIH